MSNPIEESKALSDKINILVKEVIMEGHKNNIVDDNVSIAMTSLIMCLSQVATPVLDRTPEQTAEFIKQRVLEGIHFHRKILADQGVKFPQQQVH